MPIEFFSDQTIYHDEEALNLSKNLVETIGKPQIYEMIKSYLSDAILVKAQVSSMPKFGGDIELVLKGISKLLIIMGLVYQEEHFNQIQQTFKIVFEGFQQILGSTYLSPEVCDSKVHYLISLVQTLYKYATDKHKAFIRQEFIGTIVFVADRFENNIILPLSKYELILN